MKNSFENSNNQNMKKTVEIENDSNFLNELPLVSEFKQVYSEKPALTGFAIATATDEPGNPDKTSLVVMRTFVENSDRAKSDQKYVLGIRFYNFGDMATIDVISLDRGFHKDIAYDHLKRLQWTVIDESGKEANHYNETMRAPIIIVGGHLKVDNNEKVDFSASSGDYGNDIFVSDSNDIAGYVADSCGIKLGESDKEKGEEFVADLLQFMKENKTKTDFYEKFVEFVYSKDSSEAKKFSTQQIGALISMKASDRAVNEDKSIMQTMIDEVAGGGLARHILLSHVADKIRNKETSK
jgi:hypothetical protein